MYLIKFDVFDVSSRKRDKFDFEGISNLESVLFHVLFYREYDDLSVGLDFCSSGDSGLQKNVDTENSLQQNHW